MGGLGSPYGQPGHCSPNVGGTVMLEGCHRSKRTEEQMLMIVRSPISHQKLDRCTE